MQMGRLGLGGSGNVCKRHKSEGDKFTRFTPPVTGRKLRRAKEALARKYKKKGTKP